MFHIGSPYFGLNADVNAMITQLLEGAPKLNSIDAELLLVRMYETEFGIFDHLKYKKAKPLATVALHDAEDNGKTSPLYSIIRKYAATNVGETFRLSLPQFLAHPREFVNLMLEICEQKAKDSNATLKGNEKLLEQLKTGKK